MTYANLNSHVLALAFVNGIVPRIETLLHACNTLPVHLSACCPILDVHNQCSSSKNFKN